MSKMTRKRSVLAGLLLGLLLVYGGAIHAAWLENVPVTVIQPNGDTLHLLASGDEFFNYLHDFNGYTIIQHPQNGYYVYAEKQNGKLVATNIIVGSMNPATNGLQPHALISSDEWMQRRKVWEVDDQRPQNRDVEPNHGTLNNISVFIRFSDDEEFVNSYSSIDNMFNNETENAVSMINYFRSVSYNAITIHTHFYPGHNGETIISYQDSFPRSYYQVYNEVTNPNGYQTEDQSREREFALLERAVNHVNNNSPVPTDLDIDYDDDGYVDNICFIVRGNVEGWNSLLWPHKWTLYDRTVRINGKRVYTFNFQLADATEHFNTSTMCHEMNHTLGAPDLYHYSYSGPPPVGPWDLMQSNAMPPQHCGAYMKMKYGHWIDDIPEITQVGTYTLNPISSLTPENVAYKVATDDPNQFYVLEYRNTATPFESALPGSGLLIYRIDTRFGGNKDYDPLNGIYDEVYIFRPDGTFSEDGNLENACFSANVDRTEFSQLTNPYPFFSEGGLDSKFCIYDISEAGNTISFSYTNLYNIEVSAFPEQAGTISGGGLFTEGSVCTVTATPNPGFTFMGWYGNALGTMLYSRQPEYTFTVTRDRHLYAKFVLGNYTVTTSCSPAEGGCVTGDGSYMVGSTVTLTATANTGYVFSCWTEDGQVVSTQPIYSFTILSDRNLVANFMQPTFSLGTVITNPDGSKGVVFYINPTYTGGCMVALDDVSTDCPWGSATDVSFVRNYTYTRNECLLSDLDGYANTAVLREYQSTNPDYAPGKVDFAHGWYVPSAGQLRKIFSALPFIESAITNAGGTTLSENGYWSSTENSESNAWSSTFELSSYSKTSNRSLRAVRDFSINNTLRVQVSTNDVELGNSTGSGFYSIGSQVTVTATPTGDNLFRGWTEAGHLVSQDPSYTFSAYSNRELVANFAVRGGVGTLVTNPDGSQGVLFHVTPNGSQGWMVALEDASEGCQWGPESDIIIMKNQTLDCQSIFEDQSGYYNTQLIRMTQGTDNEYAASLVDFENGWYLPSAGQLRKLYAELPMLEEALLRAGGSSLTDDVYWSSTEYSATAVSTPGFALGTTSKTSNCRVRAIHNYMPDGNNVVFLAANDESFGTVSGAGEYDYNETVTVTATPNEGYLFDHWTENGVTVSYDAEYQFPFTDSRSLIAYFVVSGSIGSIIHNLDGSLGVVFYVNPEGTEGLMVALEDVAEGCPWGTNGDILVMPNVMYTGPYALCDSLGTENTDLLRRCQGTETGYAADIVDVGNGWYLPSASQLRKLYAALSLIEEQLMFAGGNLLSTDTYWSSTEYSPSNAFSPMFEMSNSSKTDNHRVRAIRSFLASGVHSLVVRSNNTLFGSVTGSGEYEYGATVTITAVPNEGFIFDHWTEDGATVSYDATYQFTFTRNRSLVAHFVRTGSVGSIVTNDDGSRGVVFYADPSGFGGLMVALNDASGGCAWGTNEDVPTLENLNPSSVQNLLEDMNGSGNSFALRTWQNENPEYAASQMDYANGWCLPSVGQMRKLYAALPLIEKAIVNAGGTLMSDNVYWSSSESSFNQAWSPSFEFTKTNKTNNLRVRAIRSILPMMTITATANPSIGGTVEGSGSYVEGQTCTLTAMPNTGYSFIKWTKNGVTVSNNPTYSFTVNSGGDYEACFEMTPGFCNIIFDLVDSYGDGWQGNQLVVNYDGTTEQLTVPSGHTATYIRAFATGTHITLSWISGSWISECSFTVSYEDGGTIYAVSSINSSFSYEFDVDCGCGEITQTTHLDQGWTWWSTYIEQEGVDGLQMLEEGLGNHGVTVKSQNNGFDSYMEGFGWYGSLDGINNESSYQVKVSETCVVEMTGTVANPTEHPITLNTGWTWIGYPVSTSMSMEEALSGLSPMSGDMLKSQDNGFASYMDGLGWYGSLGTLNPGMGLMYKSNNGENVTLMFPSGAKGGEPKPNQTVDNNHWRPNLNAYADNMSVMAVVELDGEELRSESYELAAFANGECRGSARLMYVEPLNRYIAFLTVAGDETVELHFSLYDTGTSAVETQCFTSLPYETNAVMGSFETPYVVRFGSTTGTDEWASSLQVYPNPVDCGQNVSLGFNSAEIGKVQVEIINTLGLVETRFIASQNTITAPNIPGVYTLRITVEGKGTCYRRIVVR